MEFKEFSAKTVNDAITAACQEFTVTSDRLEYEVVEEGSSGFLGFNAKAAVIKARVKEEAEATPIVEEKKVEASEKKASTEITADVCKIATEFLDGVFKAMNLEVVVDTKFNKEECTLDVDLNGAEMGMLIGKRGQTLDSLQYLVSLVVNKETENYVKVKVDIENYRQRRKETLENLAKNISYKVKRTKRPFSLEPMNPYERRIIHSALQNDKFVTTHSEGEEPFRRVIVTLKK
ncbi:MAG: protein jag [Lachnospiraceae bacterium]|nr:protein jag [Lachnospiraceae bacterium]